MFNQAEVIRPLLELDEDVDEMQRKHTALSVMNLTESSVLAETMFGIIFCPCMAWTVYSDERWR